MANKEIDYSIPGNHCTSVVCEALGTTGIGYGGLTPEGLLQYLDGSSGGMAHNDRDVFKHNCGPDKGKRGHFRGLNSVHGH